MSRSPGLMLHLLLLLLLFLLLAAGLHPVVAWPLLSSGYFNAAESSSPAATTTINSTSCDPRSCGEFDIAELQEYVAGFNLTLPQNVTNESSADLLPFGALASDWTRLLLLQERQPQGSLLRDNLIRLSRLLIAAYFALEDDTADSDYDYGRDRNNDTGSTSFLPETEFTEQPTATDKSSEITISEPVDNESTSSTATAGLNLTGSESTTTYYERPADEAGGSFLVSGNTTDPSSSSSSSTPGSPDDVGPIVSGQNSTDESSESSRSNEAVHEKSKEDFAGQKPRDIVRFFDDHPGASLDPKNNTVDLSLNPRYGNDTSLETLFALTEATATTGTGEVNETTVDDLAELITKSVEDLFSQMSNETITLDYTNTTSSEEDLLTKSVEDFFAQASNETNSTNSNEVLLTKSVEDFFAQSSNETGKSSTEDLLTKSVEDFFAQSSNETGKSSSEDLLTKSVEDFFAQGSNETGKSSTEDLLTKSVEDFFAQSSNETVNNSSENLLTKSAEDFFARSSNETGKTSSEELLTKSVEDFFAQESNETLANSTKSMEDFFAKEGSNETSSSVEQRQLTASEEDFFAGASSNETDSSVKDPVIETTSSISIAKETITPKLEEEESVPPIVLTGSVESFFNDKEEEAVRKAHESRSVDATTTSSTETAEIPAEPKDLQVHHSRTKLVKISSETEASPLPTFNNETTTTESGLEVKNSTISNVTDIQETTTAQLDVTSAAGLVEEATTVADSVLGVVYEEKLPTPVPYIMRKVLMTFEREAEDSEPNELRSPPVDYDVREESLDTFSEPSDDFAQQTLWPEQEQGVLGTREMEPRTRKRPGALLEPQYQSLSEAEQTTPATATDWKR